MRGEKTPVTTVLVTGANRGLGLEFVRQYAARGATVIATCRDPQGADDLQALAGSNKVEIHPLDVDDSDAATRLVVALGGRPIDVFVCNAGINSPPAKIDAIDEAGFLRVMQTNVMAPMRLVGLLVDQVAASAGKKMVFLGSRMGSMGANDRGGGYVYRASKAALHAVVKSLSIDFAERGIVCVLLHPGAAKTAMAGARGTMEVADSVRGMLAIVDRATSADSGKFYNYTGEEIPW
jgi:NAD(P)-dependent dehydrogenase (short-subunit alcohol dehydrogenase family)